MRSLIENIAFRCFNSIWRPCGKRLCSDNTLRISRKMSSKLNWKPRGLLLDITGVLYESGRREAIEGSVDAIDRLRRAGLPFRFVTNESQATRVSLVSKLRSFGFDPLSEAEIVSPAVAASAHIRKHHLRPHLLTHPDLFPEFEHCDRSSPNCVVVADCSEHFTFENMNKAFQLLMTTAPNLISLGKGRYFKDKGELVMDLGGFTCALEFASGVTARVIGKPSPDYFLQALEEIGVSPDEAVMVGDDINSDVHAAQKCGLRGVLVRTGKFREEDLEKSGVNPDAVVNNLSQFIDMIL